MSIESAKAFMEKMKHDEAFRDKVNAAGDKDARQALVRAEGFDFSEDELTSVRENLSDEELDTVAGGGMLLGLRSGKCLGGI